MLEDRNEEKKSLKNLGKHQFSASNENMYASQT